MKTHWIPILICQAALAFLPMPAGAQDSELQDRINKAIDKGVAELRKHQSASGTWEYPQGFRDGMTALAGWTLLESGVSATDEQIVKTANYLREAVLRADRTYNISLMILFFDKLADPADQVIIESLAVRLLGGMRGFGGWSYECGARPEDLKKLAIAIKQEREKHRQTNADTAIKLHRDTVAQLEALRKRPLRVALDPAGIGDNSNTQFALLALWVARRHGLPVDQHLAFVQQRFEVTAAAGGGWPYQPVPPNPPGGSGSVQPRNATGPTASMTCAGLLAYAVAQGVRKDGKTIKELLEDSHVSEAFKFLTPCVEDQQNVSMGTGGVYYFFFSLERVAVIYDLKKIGETDWYVWGAKQLVKLQGKNGLWGSAAPSGVGQHGLADTCFALLFLKRANVAWDLVPLITGPVRKDTAPKVEPQPFFDLPVLVPKKSKSSGEKPSSRIAPAASPTGLTMNGHDLSLREPFSGWNHGQSTAVRSPGRLTDHQLRRWLATL